MAPRLKTRSTNTEKVKGRSQTRDQAQSPQVHHSAISNPHSDILALQQTAGNQAVSQLLQTNRGKETKPVVTPPTEVISGAPSQQPFVTQATPKQPEAKSSILGLTAEKLQLAVASLGELLPSADQEEVELANQESEVLAALSQQNKTFSVNIPIDDLLLQSKDINRELALQFLQIAFAPYGIKLEREMAESIVKRKGWKNFASQEEVHTKVADRLAKGMEVIPYQSTSESLMTTVQIYYQIRRERIQRLRRAYEDLHKSHYAEDAILDFYIAHYNGLVGVLNGVLDLPVAPYNLVKKLRGQEGIHFLGRIPRLNYRGEYGQKYGHTMETGVVAGLILAGGGVGAGGAGSASGRAALGEATGPGLSWLSRLASTPVGAGILKATRVMLLGDTLSYGGIAALDIRQATQELAALQANIRELPDGTLVRKLPDGTEHPVTVDQLDDKIAELVEQILISVLVVYGGLKAARQLRRTPPGAETRPVSEAETRSIEAEEQTQRLPVFRLKNPTIRTLPSGEAIAVMETPEGPKIRYKRTGQGGPSATYPRAGDWAEFHGILREVKLEDLASLLDIEYAELFREGVKGPADFGQFLQSRGYSMEQVADLAKAHGRASEWVIKPREGRAGSNPAVNEAISDWLKQEVDGRTDRPRETVTDIKVINDLLRENGIEVGRSDRVVGTVYIDGTVPNITVWVVLEIP